MVGRLWQPPSLPPAWFRRARPSLRPPCRDDPHPPLVRPHPSETPGPQKPEEASALLELVSTLARGLETAGRQQAAANGGGSHPERQPLIDLAARLCRSLIRLGERARAEQLAGCYGLKAAG